MYKKLHEVLQRTTRTLVTTTVVEHVTEVHKCLICTFWTVQR